mmetsp:Transcript_25380/g.47722  ORF Transcript_25380/g.47722 Transcript_25380/m.47722 type:complete len:281 (+) Transcript_25380:334-1176(+)
MEKRSQGACEHRLIFEILRFGPSTKVAEPELDAAAAVRSAFRSLIAHAAVVLAKVGEAAQALKFGLSLQESFQLGPLALGTDQHCGGDDFGALHSQGGRAKLTGHGIHVPAPQQPRLPALLASDLSLKCLNVLLDPVQRHGNRCRLVGFKPLLDLSTSLREAQRLQRLLRMCRIHSCSRDDESPCRTAQSLLKKHRELGVLVWDVRKRMHRHALRGHPGPPVEDLNDPLEGEQALVDVHGLLQPLPVEVELLPRNAALLFAADHSHFSLGSLDFTLGQLF